MIIGLTGVKRSGKNETAKIIAKLFDGKYAVKEWSFAEDLKRSSMAALSGIDYTPEKAIQYADAFKENGYITIGIEDHPEFGTDHNTITGREYLQFYGTEAHRNIFGEDFWIKNLLQKIDVDYEDGDLPRIDIITDVRFENEAQAIHSDLGFLIRVRRPEVENSGDTHVSEKPLPDELIHAEILNHGSLDDLEWETASTVGGLLYGNSGY